MALDALIYKSSNGSLANHCDELNASIVFLYSIGCTANFYIHSPQMKGDKYRDGKLFKFKSGDMLFFDASKAAQIIHGIDSIDDGSSCPQQLKQKYKHLAQSRIGVQIRANNWS